MDWMYERYWLPIKPKPSETEYRESWKEFRANATHDINRIGRSVYDIVTVKLPDGQTRTNYFDVTRQRFDWPRIK